MAQENFVPDDDVPEGCKGDITFVSFNNSQIGLFTPDQLARCLQIEEDKGVGVNFMIKGISSVAFKRISKILAEMDPLAFGESGRERFIEQMQTPLLHENDVFVPIDRRTRHHERFFGGPQIDN